MNLLKIEKQDAAQGALYQYTSTAVTFLSGILFYVFLAKAFPTTVVGEMSLILAIATIMNIIFTLGLQNGAQHFLSYYMAKNEHGKVYWLVLQLIIYGMLLALGGSFLTYALSYYIAELFFHSSSLGYIVHYLAFELFFMICFNIFNGILLGLQSFRLSAIVSIFGQSLSYLFSFILIFIFRQVQFAILGLAVGYGISVFVSLTVILQSLSVSRNKSPSAYIRPVFSYSMPILFSSIIGYGSTYIDRFVVAYFLTTAQLGVYSFVLLISGSLGILVGPISNVLLPKLSEIYSTGTREDMKRAVATASYILAYIYTPAALGVAALSREILLLFAGIEYFPGTVPLSILMFISALFITQNVLSPALFSIRATRIFMIVALSTLVSNVSLSFLLIPRFGLVGAALSNSSVSAVGFLLQYYFARRFTVSEFQIIRIAKILIGSGIMFFILMFAQMHFGFSVYLLPEYIVVGFLIFVISGKVMRIFDHETKELISGKLFPTRKAVGIIVKSLL